MLGDMVVDRVGTCTGVPFVHPVHWLHGVLLAMAVLEENPADGGKELDT